MKLEFFRQRAAPRYFDILMNTNGTLLVINSSAIRQRQMVIVLAEGKPQTPTPHQVVSIYGMISRYKYCLVGMYGLDF